MEKVRFGLVGFGLFGRHHARAISDSRAARLVAISVASEPTAQAARREYPDVAVFTDYRAMLDRSDVEVVDVVVPNHLHHEVASAALEAGRHVFLEKPMAITLEDCDRLVDEAERRGLLVAVNHELRLSSMWGGVKQRIDQGCIGRPQYALVELSRFPYRPGSGGWRWDIDRVGNWILEEPIHFFDLARWYLSGRGEPVSVYARANSRHDDRPWLRDNFSALVNFTDEAYAVVSQTLSAFEHHVTAKIAGTEGTIWAHWNAPDARSDKPVFSLRYGLGERIETVEGLAPTGELLELADHVEAVARAVREGSPLPCTAHDGRWSTRLCLAAQESVESGGVVSLTR